MPKSSSDSLTPMSATRRRIGTARSGSSMTALSVISRISRLAGSPASASAVAIFSGRPPSTLRADRLTATVMSRPASIQSRHWRSALRSTTSVSGWIRPVDSASGMNASGASRPWLGWRQRTSASTATIAPVGQVELGLVEQLELVPLEREVQVGQHGQPLGPALVELVAVEHGLRRAPSRRTSRCRRAAACPSRSRRRPTTAMPEAGAGADQTLGQLDRLAQRAGDLGRDGTARRSGRRRSSRSRTANSSPPSRATTAPFGTASGSRSATTRSSWSPTWCPSASLTSLNRSRSSSSTAQRDGSASQGPGSAPRPAGRGWAARSACRAGRRGAAARRRGCRAWRPRGDPASVRVSVTSSG